MMTPQLFINYRLKSTAHMPWRTFMYKVRCHAGSVHSGRGGVHSGRGGVHSGRGGVHSGRGSVHRIHTAYGFPLWQYART
eukprot:scaffold25732_cov95-Isochrysis_galbana.AAC.1